MDVSYCKKWWDKRKKMIDEISKSDAEILHNKGDNYTAVIKEKEKVEYVIDISAKNILVRFYDDEMYLVYEFDILNNGKMFLKAAFYYTYEASELLEILSFNFSQSGYVYMCKQNLITYKSEERESIVNVSNNWEDFPKFGEYTSIIKKKRA